MELEDKKEEVAEAGKKTFSDFLEFIGLSNPIDYTFLDYSMHKSRENVISFKEDLNFFFHLILKEVEDSDHPFPMATWCEKISEEYFDTNTETPDEVKTRKKIVLWTTLPSDKWPTREVLNFNQFHLYFLDVIKPLQHFSAEELYRVIDQKRGEVYFLTIGSRKNVTGDKTLIILFITSKYIVSFHVPEHKDFETGSYSKWVSLTEKFELKYINEFQLFRLPEGNLVMSKEEVEKVKQTEELDTEMKLETYTIDECESCGS